VEALDVLREALEEAQTELGTAEIALCEANARAEQARVEHARLEAAVAALSGEPPPAAASAPAEAPIEVTEAENTPSGEDNAPIHEMSPEEFDAHRKKRQRQKEREAQANNPYAHVKCSGCGQLGTMADTILTAPSGAPVRMMTCGSCGNQIMQ
jgi:hypothetical protein